MKRFIHIIPANAIGGVESAAETTRGMLAKTFNLEIIYLSSIQNNNSFFSKFIYLLESFINTAKVLKRGWRKLSKRLSRAKPKSISVKT